MRDGIAQVLPRRSSKIGIPDPVTKHPWLIILFRPEICLGGNLAGIRLA